MPDCKIAQITLKEFQEEIADGVYDVGGIDISPDTQQSVLGYLQEEVEKACSPSDLLTNTEDAPSGTESLSEQRELIHEEFPTDAMDNPAIDTSTRVEEAVPQLQDDLREQLQQEVATMDGDLDFKAFSLTALVLVGIGTLVYKHLSSANNPKQSPEDWTEKVQKNRNHPMQGRAM